MQFLLTDCALKEHLQFCIECSLNTNCYELKSLFFILGLVKTKLVVINHGQLIAVLKYKFGKIIGAFHDLIILAFSLC